MTNLNRTNKEIDVDLVKRALKSPDDFALIIEKYKEPLKRYIRRIAHPTNDETDILLQDIFIKIYENLNDFNQDLTFSSWIYRIAHNETIDSLRKKKRYGGSLDDPAYEDDAITLVETIASDEDTSLNIDRYLLQKNITKILDGMDPKYRSVLVLKFLEDRDYNEISDILKKPPGTIATLIHRAKKEFKRSADEQGLNKEEI